MFAALCILKIDIITTIDNWFACISFVCKYLFTKKTSCFCFTKIKNMTKWPFCIGIKIVGKKRSFNLYEIICVFICRICTKVYYITPGETVILCVMIGLFKTICISQLFPVVFFYTFICMFCLPLFNFSIET